MKTMRIAFSIWLVGLFLAVAITKAQDADKQKLIAIEKAFAAAPNPGPQQAQASKKYLYDGSLDQLTPMGRIGTLSRARVVELSTSPDPSDPDVKSVTNLTEFHVDIYGDTALVAYKDTNTDTGHKDASLNTTDHFGCLDTFVKRNGEWLLVGNACSPASPLPKSEWDAAMKQMKQEPKDVQQAYH